MNIATLKYYILKNSSFHLNYIEDFNEKDLYVKYQVDIIDPSQFWILFFGIYYLIY